MASVTVAATGTSHRAADAGAAAAFGLGLLFIRAPAMVFLGTLAVMLFRPPGPHFASTDRLAFALLLAVIFTRLVVLRERLVFPRLIVIPMTLLALLGLFDLLAEPFDAQNWSIFAAKWAVPLVFYCLSGYVFSEDASRRQFETFALLTLGYLCFVAIAFLTGAKGLIFPRYILDPNLGIHFDRARGPFLQAVANGVTLNMLGVVALAAIARGRLRGLGSALMLIALPFAILATKTRAVWVSFFLSLALAALLCGNRRLRRSCVVVILVAGVGTATVLLSGDYSFAARLHAESPIEYRVSVYRAAWQMFLEKPCLGWGTQSVQSELARRITGFKVDAFFFHNTYLEIAVERGLFGFALYLWILVDLFRLASPRQERPGGALDGGDFRKLWPVILFAYLFNAGFVVMNYQFVNGVLFALAGILGAENRRAELHARFARP